MKTLILMWTTTLTLAWFVQANNDSIARQLQDGETSIAKALEHGNMFFMASLTIMGLTTIAATALAVRRFLA
jgi:hypothetical protein